MKGDSKNKTEISFLYEISKELRKVKRIEESVKPILKHIADYLNIMCCSLTILKPNSSEIILEEIYGLNPEENTLLQKHLQSVRLKVIETGEPMLLTKITHEPHFIKSSRDLSDFKVKHFKFI